MQYFYELTDIFLPGGMQKNRMYLPGTIQEFTHLAHCLKLKKEDELMPLVDQLTIEHQADAELPRVADGSVDKICKILNVIVGFELKVER